MSKSTPQTDNEKINEKTATVTVSLCASAHEVQVTLVFNSEKDSFMYCINADIIFI